MFYHFHTKPFQHQKKALKVSIDSDYYAYLMDPGTGKTKTAIDYIGCRYLRDGHTKVLVICPASVIGVWEEQIEEHLPPSIKRKVFRLEGMRRHSIITENKSCPVLTIFLISYDTMWRTKKPILKWKPQGIICDESHYIKSPTSARSRGVHSLTKVSQWRLILTGTFIANSPLDSYSQMKFLDPAIFPMSWTKFKERYAVWVNIKGQRWKKLKRYKRLKELNQKIMAHAIKVEKDKALDLPKRIDIMVPVEMTQKAWKAYNTMKKDKILKFKQGKAKAELMVTELIRFQQITSGFVVVETGEYDKNDKPIRREVNIHDEKIKALIELINIHLAYKEKIVVFCQFKWEIKQIQALLTKHKIDHATLDGATKGRVRDDIRRRFQSGTGPKVIVANIAAGGIGITLTAANVAIFYSLSNSLTHYLQARDRLHRPGQHRPVTYYHLLVKGSIDEKIMKVNKEKKNLADLVTAKNWKDFI